MICLINWAIIKGNANAVKSILAKGANVENKNRDGRTPAELLVLHPHAEIQPFRKAQPLTFSKTTTKLTPEVADDLMTPIA